MGKVVLIGAGPGDVDLLTVKGKEYIKKADCIIYDRLASKDILDYSKPDCECIFVGKENHHHVLKQEEINRLLLKKANEYTLVVRLKGGDPYVFGRGGEEALFLKEHGVKTEVISGVTSVVSVLASAGIPITHRGVAKGFQVITAHSKKDEVTDIDYSQLLDESVTLVFLMGLAHVAEIARGLISAGRDEKTPAAVISKGTTPYQKTCIGTLFDIGEKVAAAKLESPSIIVVGDVARLSEQLNAYENRPLYGKKILVPYIEGFEYSYTDGIVAKEEHRLKVLLREEGAIVDVVKVGRIRPKSFAVSFDGAKKNWIVFTSANGIYAFMHNLKEQGMDVRNLFGCKIAVVGEKTAAVLEKFSLSADFIPKVHTAESLFEELKTEVEEDAEITYFGAKDSAVLPGNVKPVVAYENEPVDVAEITESYDFVCFTSASGVRRLLPFLKDSSANMISIGPSCSKALQSFEIRNFEESEEASYEGMVQKILGTI